MLQFFTNFVINNLSMEISELGEFALIDRLCESVGVKQQSTIHGVGDDAAVIEFGDKYLLSTTELFCEGVAFDLVYTPLKHLGFKCVVAALSDIIAMNGRPTNIMVSVAVSARFNVENLDELYAGIKLACEKYGVEIIGGDLTSSLTGLTISVSAMGEVEKGKLTLRSGAKPTDIICVTGDLGAAYLGTKLLEREKRVLKGNNIAKPEFEGFEYLLERALKPLLRDDVIKALDDAGIVPTSMIDLSDGVASEIKHICKSSGCGAKIDYSRIPISSKSIELGEKMNIDPVIAALNGGDDYELMFTLPVGEYENLSKIGGIDVIGYITEGTGAFLLTHDSSGEIELTAQGWK